MLEGVGWEHDTTSDRHRDRDRDGRRRRGEGDKTTARQKKDRNEIYKRSQNTKNNKE